MVLGACNRDYRGGFGVV